MSDLIKEISESVYIITLNRIDKHNALNQHLLTELKSSVEEANQLKKIQVILIKANGRYFSAGADLKAMEALLDSSETENLADASLLAETLFSIYRSAKTTIALIQGPAIGGGVGLLATCDLAIASHKAEFSFSELTLGLIPAVISPYIVHALGARQSNALFLSAEKISAQRAYELSLIHHLVDPDSLDEFGLQKAHKISSLAPDARLEAKKLVQNIAHQEITQALSQSTAQLLAKIRMGEEARQGIRAYMKQRTAHWA